MFGRIILWSALWVTLLCEWIPQRNEARFKKNLVLGVTLPREAREDPQVAEILREFQKQTDLSGLILMILSAAGVFIADLTASLLCWSAMLVVILLVPMAVFAGQNRKLRALKKNRGWTVSSSRKIRVDAEAMIDYPKPGCAGYLICGLLCLIPMLAQRAIWWVHLMDLGIAAMSYGFAVFCYRKKSETVDADAERTRALSALRYRKWKQIWLLCACSGVLTSYSLWIMDFSQLIGMSLAAITAALVCAALIGLEMQTRRQQEQLTEDSGTDWYADEDDCWLGGMFYCNPNDSHVMVNARTGIGTTVNLATAGGKIVSGLTVLLVAGSLVLLAALAMGDKSEIRLEYAGETISCENGSTHYEVAVSEIESAELVDELPEGLWRTWGTGGQYLIKGSFTANEYPDLQIIADPTCPPYLLLRTEDGTAYLFSARDSAVTRAAFAALPVR